MFCEPTKTHSLADRPSDWKTFVEMARRKLARTLVEFLPGNHFSSPGEREKNGARGFIA
jgi:hypothetical protein